MYFLFHFSNISLGRLIILSLFINQIFCIKIEYKSCGGQITEVRAIGCDGDKEPCRLKKGTNPRLEVDFISPFQARFVIADVKGKIEGSNDRLPVYIPWSGMHKNACNGHGILCPIKRNSKYTYHYEMKVGSNIPSFKTEYTWQLANLWGTVIACFSMPLEVY